MHTQEEYISLFNSTLKQITDSFPKKYKSLYEPIEYSMDAGGKRLRPTLLMMAAEGFGAPVADAAIQAVGIEMFHNFTLLHDDVMDKSDTRRGRPTVHTKWDDNTAILSGDAMLTISTELMCRTPDTKLRTVLETFNRGAVDVFEGQCLDMEFETKEDVSISQYITMIGLKTGALLGAATKIGALIGGATDEDAERCHAFGMLLGYAFQIWDDYLDVYGDPASFGKPIGGDILNNKKTFLLLNGYACADSNLRLQLIDAMQALHGNEKINRVREIFTEMGIPALCRAEIEKYSDEALKTLASTAMSTEAKEEFDALTRTLIGRDR